MEGFKNLFRYKLYERTNILANDLTDIFKEIKIFIDEKVKPELEKSEVDKYIFEGIELRKEEFKWRINNKEEITDEVKEYITLDKINEKFKGKKEFLKSLEENYEISMFPQDLYGKALVVFSEVLTEYINKNELLDKLELFDILTIDNNGSNNIIY